MKKFTYTVWRKSSTGKDEATVDYTGDGWKSGRAVKSTDTDDLYNAAQDIYERAVDCCRKDIGEVKEALDRFYKELTK